ncbi:MAG: hypothetical protein AAF696_34765, partial [Bacteroidota bacterium]
MDSSSMDTEQDILNIKCPNCGSPHVAFSAEHQALYCSYCEYTKHLPKDSDEIVERPLTASYHADESPKGMQIAAKEIHCESCGSDTMISREQVNVTCPFCGSTQVNEKAMSQRVIQPSGVLPFSVTKEEAGEKFNSWIGSNWFSPSNLSKKAQINSLKGVYLPFWTFDAFTESRWRAEAGYYYYVKEKVRGPDGRIETRSVRKIRWQPASGFFDHFFDDTLICASHGVGQKLVDQVLPYHLMQVVNFDNRYLLGWDTELYQKDLREGYEVADKKMDSFIRSACASRIPGDTYRNLRIQTEKHRHTFKHILLPLWIAGYSYRGKIFQFIVNGQSGKISGKRPLSWIKIALLILLIGLIVALIYYFNEVHGQGA